MACSQTTPVKQTTATHGKAPHDFKNMIPSEPNHVHGKKTTFAPGKGAFEVSSFLAS